MKKIPTMKKRKLAIIRILLRVIIILWVKIMWELKIVTLVLIIIVMWVTQQKILASINKLTI